MPKVCKDYFLAQALFTYLKFMPYLAFDRDFALVDLAELMSQLPYPHKCLLKRVLTLVQKVLEHKNNNKMTNHSLATLLGPLFLRSPGQDDTSLVAHSTLIISLAVLLIDYGTEMLKVSVVLCCVATRRWLTIVAAGCRAGYSLCGLGTSGTRLSCGRG